MLSFGKYLARFREVCAVVYGGCEVHQGSERYSSKTCSWCNRLHEKLGGSREFKCPYPDCIVNTWTIDRDGNGAQNIELLSYLDGIFPHPSDDVWNNPDYKRWVSANSKPNKDGTIYYPPAAPGGAT